MDKAGRALSAAVILLALSVCVLGAATYDIRDFGAAGDGRTLDTAAIQAAINAAAGAGGGTVSVPSGRYLTGTIFLKSRIELRLEHGSVLLGSTDIEDYPEVIVSFRSYTDNYVRRALIQGEGLREVSITGSGTIDGQGGHENWNVLDYISRPYLIRMVSCRNVRVEGITLRDSPMWVQHYLDCDYLQVRGLTVISQANHNNDMIDIDSCRNVWISDCYADSEDDAITLKSTSGVITENVSITNCVLRSQCYAIKMGTESSGGFRNITISNCSINSDYSMGPPGYLDRRRGLGGVALELVDGGVFENVTITNLTIRNVEVPIFVRLGNRARPYTEGIEKPGMGTMKNIVISNVVASDVDSIACSITGLPGYPVRNITLRDIRITYPGGGTAGQAVREVPEHPTQYPEATMFGMLPAWGIYFRHVEGIRMEGIDLESARADQRPALVFDDVTELDIDGFSGQKPGGGGPAIVMRGVRRALVRGSRPDRNSRTFIRLEKGTENVSVVANDLSPVSGEKFEFAAGVERTALHESANRMK